MARSGAARLDRRVAFYRYAETPASGKVTATRNALNEVVRPDPATATPAPDPFCEAWAARMDLSDAERLKAGIEDGFLRTRWTVRSNAKTRSITAGDMMIADGRNWDIKGVKEAGGSGRHRYLEITAVEEL
ncbi:phage head completion protein [Maritimibacter alexandrii]|uniref:phage head completion protein n=1 Tax=Maritimibacter alexandrii TaxID=2570355 RepID=UPI001107F390|nr:head-tail adaptor protein [Maritimibacter alexandrii]